MALTYCATTKELALISVFKRSSGTIFWKNRALEAGGQLLWYAADVADVEVDATRVLPMSESISSRSASEY